MTLSEVTALLRDSLTFPFKKILKTNIKKEEEGKNNILYFTKAQAALASGDNIASNFLISSFP